MKALPKEKTTTKLTLCLSLMFQFCMLFSYFFLNSTNNEITQHFNCLIILIAKSFSLNENTANNKAHFNALEISKMQSIFRFFIRKDFLVTFQQQLCHIYFTTT